MKITGIDARDMNNHVVRLIGANVLYAKEAEPNDIIRLFEHHHKRNNPRFYDAFDTLLEMETFKKNMLTWDSTEVSVTAPTLIRWTGSGQKFSFKTYKWSGPSTKDRLHPSVCMDISVLLRLEYMPETIREAAAAYVRLAAAAKSWCAFMGAVETYELSYGQLKALVPWLQPLLSKDLKGYQRLGSARIKRENPFDLNHLAVTTLAQLGVLAKKGVAAQLLDEDYTNRHMDNVPQLFQNIRR